MPRQPAKSWRALLAELTETPSEKQRVAQELGIRTWTLSKWVTGKAAAPRPYTLKKVPDLFPQHRSEMITLLRQEFPDLDFPQDTVKEHEEEPLIPIPAVYYERHLQSFAHNEPMMATWSIIHLSLIQLATLLDADRSGLTISVLPCTPPRTGSPVRSLYLFATNSTLEGGTTMVPRFINFFGAESLVGQSIQQGSPLVVEDFGDSTYLNHLNGAVSAAAYPIQRYGATAGCLCAESVQAGFFHRAQLQILQQYADVLSLAFRNFYQTLALFRLPLLAAQPHHWPPFQPPVAFSSFREPGAEVLQRLEDAVIEGSINDEQQ